MSLQKFKSSAILKYNGHEVARLSCPFSYEEVESEISKLLKEDVPILCVIHGIPGIGKSLLGSLLSERLLHCAIIDFDAFCRTGKSCVLKVDPKFIVQSMKLIFQVYAQFACNVIYTTSMPQNNILENVVPEFYDLIVVEFERLDPEFSALHNINGLDIEDIEHMIGQWKPYSLERRRKDA